MIALQESKGLDLEELATHLQPFGIERGALRSLIQIFEHAKTFGSLIQIPQALNEQLAGMTHSLRLALQDGDLYARQAAKDLLPLVLQTLILGMKFDAVVANPPYMGTNSMNSDVKIFAKTVYPTSKNDLFSMFIERNIKLCKISGLSSLVTMQGWMFLTSFEELRNNIISTRTIFTLTQIGYNSFPEINSKVAQACAFTMAAFCNENYVGRYIDLNSAEQSADKNHIFINRTYRNTYNTTQSRFRKAPGLPIAYWTSDKQLNAFSSNPSIRKIADPCAGMSSTDNTIFLRLWHEIDILLQCRRMRIKPQKMVPIH
jgi:hypothetical protein